jgi:DNA repair protein RadA/Sms
MAKSKTVYVCQECGRNSPREMGRCPGCGAWNSFVEEIISPASASAGAAQRMSGARSEPQRLSEIAGDPWASPLPMEEFARVLGGGVVPGSIVLIGGEPG